MKDKAHENIKLVKGFYMALRREESGVIRNMLDPNVEWIEPSLPGLWFSGTHRGADAVLQEVIGPTAQKIERFRLKMKKFFAVGDHVIAIGSFHGFGKSTGLELYADTAHVWTLRSGKAVRFEGFHDPTNWREVMGLVEPESQRMAA
jgi:ketosteroid isomerase-like protein